MNGIKENRITDRKKITNNLSQTPTATIVWRILHWLYWNASALHTIFVPSLAWCGYGAADWMSSVIKFTLGNPILTHLLWHWKYSERNITLAQFCHNTATIIHSILIFSYPNVVDDFASINLCHGVVSQLSICLFPSVSSSSVRESACACSRLLVCMYAYVVVVAVTRNALYCVNRCLVWCECLQFRCVHQPPESFISKSIQKEFLFRFIFFYFSLM